MILEAYHSCQGKTCYISVLGEIIVIVILKTMFSGVGECNDPLGRKHSVIRSVHIVRPNVTPDHFSEMSTLHRTVEATENMTLILVIFKLLLTYERLLGPQ